MFFTVLVFVSAFLIEAIGSFVSVLGLSVLFASNPIVIALAVALDIGKVVAVSFLYKYWAKINFLMKTYMTLAACVLVLITSTGAFGFLSGEFQKAISGTSQQTVLISTMTDEKGRLQKRKEEIDKQIAQLPDSNVRGRRQLMQQFGPEIKQINERLVDIDKKLPELRIANIDKETHAGPIVYIAGAFDTTPEKAVKWVILIIIFVFDPLAVALLIAGNFLLDLRKKEAAIEPVIHVVNVTPEPATPEPVIAEPEATPEPVIVAEPTPTPTPQPIELARATELLDIFKDAPPAASGKFREKVVIVPPKPKKPKVKIVDKVITLEKPPLKRSMLEDITSAPDTYDETNSAASKHKTDYS